MERERNNKDLGRVGRSVGRRENDGTGVGRREGVKRRVGAGKI
jgi:hypothetical protein